MHNNITGIVPWISLYLARARIISKGRWTLLSSPLLDLLVVPEDSPRVSVLSIQRKYIRCVTRLYARLLPLVCQRRYEDDWLGAMGREAARPTCRGGECDDLVATRSGRSARGMGKGAGWSGPRQGRRESGWALGAVVGSAVFCCPITHYRPTNVRRRPYRG